MNTNPVKYGQSNFLFYDQPDKDSENTQTGRIQDKHDYLRAAERLFNLGAEDRIDFTSITDPDNIRDLDTYLSVISRLLKKGIVGYEFLKVNTRPYKSFITTRIGDQRLYGAKQYRNRIDFKYS